MSNLLTKRDAAQQLGVSEPTLRKMIRLGQLATVDRHGRVYVPASTVVAHRQAQAQLETELEIVAGAVEGVMSVLLPLAMTADGRARLNRAFPELKR